MKKKHRIQQTRLSSALALAEMLHAGQTRKIGKNEDPALAVPYITHLTEVMSLMVLAHADEDQMIAGLLHDSLEDQPSLPSGAATAAVIRENFGDRVLSYVEHCSDHVPPTGWRRLLHRSNEKGTWRGRKERHIAHLRAAAAADPGFLLITLCDKLSNARAIVDDVEHHGPVVWSRFNAPPTEIAWYYGQMAGLISEFADEIPHAAGLIARLNRSVDRLAVLAAEAAAPALS